MDPILKTFSDIIRDVRILSNNELENKYSEFKEEYPKIYKLAIDSVLENRVQESLEILKMMLKSNNNIDKGHITKFNADLLIGNQLGKKYIYPLVGNPTTNELKTAIDKIKMKKT